MDVIQRTEICTLDLEKQGKFSYNRLTWSNQFKILR